MKYLILFCLLITSLHFSWSQDAKTVDRIIETYTEFKEPTITHRRFKHKDIQPLVLGLGDKPGFQVEEVARSIEGKEIYHVQFGSGSIHVLLWSQMHGNEPTATMALMDLFNLFSREGEFEPWKEALLEKITLHVVPMLNPDGADRFRRRNHLDVDLNRDALRLQSPEAQILKKIRDKTQADFGFNLHDQGRTYSAGNHPKPATISFLSPPVDYARTKTKKRKDAMKLIGLMTDKLNEYIPGQVGKYDDSFEPRAFGDNIQKWGTRTILIESGGQFKDREKQEIRRLNFIALLSAFQWIADGSYKRARIKTYENLPFNNRRFHDLIIRNVKIYRNDQPFIVDIAMFKYEENYPTEHGFYFRGRISELGDLSTFYGYEELDASGMTAFPGTLSPEVIPNEKAAQDLDWDALFSEGHSHVRIQELPDRPFTPYPINFASPFQAELHQEILLNRPANFFLKKGNQTIYAVINGFLYKIGEDPDVIKNGLAE